jgi:hypothetical protein
MAKPINFKPARAPSVKWSSASASFPGVLPRSFCVILIVGVDGAVWVAVILSSSGTVKWWFLRNTRNPDTDPRGRLGETPRRSAGELSGDVTGGFKPGAAFDRLRYCSFQPRPLTEKTMPNRVPDLARDAERHDSRCRLNARKIRNSAADGG